MLSALLCVLFAGILIGNALEMLQVENLANSFMTQTTFILAVVIVIAEALIVFERRFKEGMRLSQIGLVALIFIFALFLGQVLDMPQGEAHAFSETFTIFTIVLGILVLLYSFRVYSLLQEKRLIPVS